MRYVLRVVGTRFGGETEFGADESGGHFRNDLFGRMSVRAEAVAELAIEPRSRPMAKFVGKHAHVPEIAIHGRRADKGFLLRHRDLVGRQRVKRAVTTVIDPGTGAGNETVEFGRPAHGAEIRLFDRKRCVPVNLCRIENGRSA